MNEATDAHLDLNDVDVLIGQLETEFATVANPTHAIQGHSGACSATPCSSICSQTCTATCRCDTFAC
jgi:hypothetical protein